MKHSRSIRNGAWTTRSSAIHRANNATSHSCRDLTRTRRVDPRSPSFADDQIRRESHPVSAQIACAASTTRPSFARSSASLRDCRRRCSRSRIDRPGYAKPLSTAIAALCVRAIWNGEGALEIIPGLGALNERQLAFTAISEIPVFGNRAAAISCCREAPTNALVAIDCTRGVQRRHRRSASRTAVATTSVRLRQLTRRE